jgi:hypothetical protein
MRPSFLFVERQSSDMTFAGMISLLLTLPLPIAEVAGTGQVQVGPAVSRAERRESVAVRHARDFAAARAHSRPGPDSAELALLESDHVKLEKRTVT